MNLHPAAAIFITFLTGALTSYLANKRGRSRSVWFIVGVFLGLLGTLILMLLPKRKAEEKAAKPIQPAMPTIENQKLWYYLDEKNEQCGPISTSRLQEDLMKGNLLHSTFVWNEEMEEWKKISDIEETRNFLQFS